MATLHNAAPSRKRMTTYGKAAPRKRMPDFSFTSLAHRSQTPEVKPSEMLFSKAPNTSFPDFNKAKSTPKSLVSRSGSPASPLVSADVFDVPSSDDEAPAPSQPVPRAIKLQTRALKVAKEPLMIKKEDNEGRKRVKLSPVRPAQKLSPAKPVTKTMSPKTKSQSLETAASPLARQKPIHKRPPRARTPRELTPDTKTLPLSTPPQKASHTDIMELDSPASFISPRGLQLWKDLLEPVESEEEISNDDLTRDRVISPHTSGKTLFKSAEAVKGRIIRSLPRRRIIDSLVEQASSDDNMEEDESNSDQSNSIVDLAPISEPESRSLSVDPEVPDVSASQSQSQGSQIVGPRFTYTKQRSMLAEADFLKQLEFDMPSQPAQPTLGRRSRRGSIPTLPKLQSFHEEEEDSVTAIRSVHELRQAGANNRFMDEIEDLLDRIGSPTATASSMRRSALLEIASKIKDKTFARQFRSHGVEQRLFVQMGRETDLIAGFTMVSILMALLAEASILPHVVSQLRTQGIARLLIRLLDSNANIISTAKERKSNMSKVGQSLMTEHVEFLLSLHVWEEVQPKMQPKIISPRTVALKCLELMVRQTREAGSSGDIISKELTTKLFSILKSASDDSVWELPNGKEAVDFGLALSAIESHSIAARTLSDENIWLVDYLPIIADTLEIALTQPTEKFGDLQFLILRLTLNVTNNNDKASNVFARKSLVAIMGQAIVSMFTRISRFLTEEEFSVTVENLVILQGAMINFAEWSHAARDSFQDLQDTSEDTLDKMVQLLVENQERTALAESIEDNQKNVAFGYLSILLGYLCLSPIILERVRCQMPGRTVRSLLASIEEFIGHHKTVDDLLVEENGHNPNAGLTERLEGLVNRLKAMKVSGK